MFSVRGLSQTHPPEACGGHSGVCERYSISLGAAAGGEHGAEAVGADLHAAPAEPRWHGAVGSHPAGRLAPAPSTMLRGLPGLAGYGMWRLFIQTQVVCNLNAVEIRVFILILISARWSAVQEGDHL